MPQTAGVRAALRKISNPAHLKQQYLDRCIVCDANLKQPGRVFFLFFPPLVYFKHAISSFLWSVFTLTSGVRLSLNPAESCVGVTGTHKCCYGVGCLNVNFLLRGSRRVGGAGIAVVHLTHQLTSFSSALCLIPTLKAELQMSSGGTLLKVSRWTERTNTSSLRS